MNNQKKIFVALALFVVASSYWIWQNKEPSCEGNVCNNLDAKNQRCNRDAITNVDSTIDKVNIQLRYSPRCDASWVKADVPPESILYLQDEKENKFGEWLVPDKAHKIAGPQYGNMGAGKNLKACVKLPSNKFICTNLFK